MVVETAWAWDQMMMMPLLLFVSRQEELENQEVCNFGE
jgi:hypothetical protein